MPSAVVTFNGRVTLPLNVRKQLGLKTGDTIQFVETEEGRFSILPGPHSIDDARLASDYDPVAEEMDEFVH
jgi:antitoxin PrlF